MESKSAATVKNMTVHVNSTRNSPSKDSNDANIGTLATIVTVASLNLLFNVALLSSAAFHHVRVCKLLLAWLAWTAVLILLICITIIYYLTIVGHFLDGLRVLMIYGCGILLQLFCIWVVSSYYKHLKFMAHGPCQGYRIVFNSRNGDAQFGEPSTVEPSIAISSQPIACSNTNISDISVVMLDNRAEDEGFKL